MHSQSGFERTNPRHDADWIEWGGGVCPVPLNTEIEYRLRWFTPEQTPFRCEAGWCRWDHGRTPDSNPELRISDIIAYRVVRS